MDYWLILLRLVHILTGVFWVGAALAITFFISPAVNATAEAGQKFMGYLMTQSRFSAAMTACALTAVTAGTILYWIDSDGFSSAWMSAGPGIGFGVGAAFAVIGLAAGLTIPRTAATMGRLAAQFQGPPTPEQQTQMAVLRKRQVFVSRINAYALVIATILMAAARYLSF